MKALDELGALRRVLRVVVDHVQQHVVPALAAGAGLGAFRDRRRGRRNLGCRRRRGPIAGGCVWAPFAEVDGGLHALLRCASRWKPRPSSNGHIARWSAVAWSVPASPGGSAPAIRVMRLAGGFCSPEVLAAPCPLVGCASTE